MAGFQATTTRVAGWRGVEGPGLFPVEIQDSGMASELETSLLFNDLEREWKILPFFCNASSSFCQRFSIGLSSIKQYFFRVAVSSKRKNVCREMSDVKDNVDHVEIMEGGRSLSWS